MLPCRQINSASKRTSVWKVKGRSCWDDPIGVTGCVCWLLSFPLCHGVIHAFNIIFDPCPGDDVTILVTTKHKEEGKHRRKLYTADRNIVMHEFKTHAHPLTDQSFDLVNTVNRKVAEKCVSSLCCVCW